MAGLCQLLLVHLASFAEYAAPVKMSSIVCFYVDTGRMIMRFLTQSAREDVYSLGHPLRHDGQHLQSRNTDYAGVGHRTRGRRDIRPSN